MLDLRFSPLPKNSHKNSTSSGRPTDPAELTVVPACVCLSFVIHPLPSVYLSIVYVCMCDCQLCIIIHLPIHPSIHHLAVHPLCLSSIYLSMHPSSIYPPIHLPTYLFVIYLPTYPSTHLLHRSHNRSPTGCTN